VLHCLVKSEWTRRRKIVLGSFKVLVINLDNEDDIKELVFYWLVSNVENNIQVNYLFHGINLNVPLI
jgi:hypothetical protein